MRQGGTGLDRRWSSSSRRGLLAAVLAAACGQSRGAGFLVAAFGLWSAAPATARAMTPAERERIERLIRHVAAQRGLQFLRNGETHDAAGAAAHLRAKLERAGDRVHGVDEFIDGVASRSWLSGQPYRVRLADGRELAARDWLRAELIRLETAGMSR